eukprot:CAMPEP_0117679862 /NCGR_PEP_ID=MMETSP0804-20121206/18034_1 /TAXON_ID=1074897 /ORGANISM="Tetraselmis astigmatica, Strain CCMP880" /LENGTH=559 /DNA_ID=CAMNT_0005489299 /DNA_START=126 /DNA_END=1806 /DNA_ORIENTATION=+
MAFASRFGARLLPSASMSAALLLVLAALLVSPAHGACSRGDTSTLCSNTPLYSERDLWSQALTVDGASGASYVGGHFSGQTAFQNDTRTAKAAWTCLTVEWTFTATPWATQGGEDLPIGFVSEYMKIKAMALDPTGDLLYVSGHYSGVVEAGGQRILRSTEEISQDVFVLQLNAHTGQLNWAVSVGGDSIDSAHGLAVDSDSAYLSGSFFHMAEFGKDVLYAPHGMEGAFVMRLSSAGSIVWTQSVAHVLPSFELSDIRGESLAVVGDGRSLRLTGTLGAPKTPTIATTQSMPSMFTLLMDSRTGSYVDGTQDFFAFSNANLMATQFDSDDNSLVALFWCDESSKGVVADSGVSVWCTDNHEKIIAFKMEFNDGSPMGTVTYLKEVADAFLLGSGRFLEPSVSIAQRSGHTYLMGSVEGMVTFNDGSASGRTLRSSNPRVFLAHLGLDGNVNSVEVLGGESSVMLVTALGQNAKTGGLEFTGVFKGQTQLGGSSGVTLKSNNAERWNIYTASVVESHAKMGMFDMFADPATRATLGAASVTGSRKGVLNTLMQQMSDTK